YRAVAISWRYLRRGYQAARSAPAPRVVRAAAPVAPSAAQLTAPWGGEPCDHPVHAAGSPPPRRRRRRARRAVGVVVNVGTIVGGRFTIEAFAGRGGMGAVFRARDEHTGDLVALKVVFAPDGDVRLRFRREVDALAALSHPAIARYVEHGET